MKHINKGDEPLSFSEWKNLGAETDNWNARYNDLRSPEKEVLHSQLISEQGSLCCYCEQTIKISSSHIEHLSPRSLKRVDELDYSNLLASCGRNRTKNTPRHCGDLKGDTDERLMVSPLNALCETTFKFKFDGRIEGTDDLSQNTIRILGLDIPKLNALRKSAIEPFIYDDNNLDQHEKFVSLHLEPDENNNFAEFWNTINQLFAE